MGEFDETDVVGKNAEVINNVVLHLGYNRFDGRCTAFVSRSSFSDAKWGGLLPKLSPNVGSSCHET